MQGRGQRPPPWQGGANKPAAVHVAMLLPALAVDNQIRMAFETAHRVQGNEEARRNRVVLFKRGQSVGRQAQAYERGMQQASMPSYMLCGRDARRWLRSSRWRHTLQCLHCCWLGLLDRRPIRRHRELLGCGMWNSQKSTEPAPSDRAQNHDLTLVWGNVGEPRAGLAEWSQ